MPHYCDIAPGHPIHGPYHDTEYGFRSVREDVIFERMALEIMQAGLSWEIVLKKRAAMRRAFDGFKTAKVAAYTGQDIERLMADEAIIRNRRKIEAIIHNANMVLEIKREHKSLAAWLDSHHPQSHKAWVKTLKTRFKFMGPEIAKEFLMSLGYLEGAHRSNCPIYKEILKLHTTA